MKTTTSFLVMSLIVIQAFAQQQALHQVEQLNETEPKLSDWFSKRDIPAGDLYAVLLPLGNCPRCEGAIAPFFKDISRIINDEETLLIVVYPYQLAALDYLKKKNYGASRIVVIEPNDELFDNFKFSTSGVQVPYIMKFDTKRGVLLKSDALLGLQYKEEIAESYFQAFEKPQQSDSSFIIDDKSDKPILKEKSTALQFSASFKDYPNIKYEPEFMLNYKQYLIDQSEFILSDIMNFSISDDMQHITIDDHLTDKSIHYILKDSVFKVNASTPDSSFNDRLFIEDDIPSMLVDYLKATNVLHTMFLKSIMSSGSVFCTASLPHLFYEDRENESIGYKNKPVIFHRKIDTDHNNGEWSKVTFEEEAINKIKGFSHTNFFVIENSIYLPVKTGWPITGTGDTPESESDNPFNENFYQQTPALNMFDLSGNFVSTVGSLPVWHKQHKTGYSFFKPIIKKGVDSNFYLMDSYIGQLYTLSSQMERNSRVTTIFEAWSTPEDSVKLQEISLEYFTELGSVLNKKVIDFIVKDDLVYSIIFDGSYFYISQTTVGTSNTKLIKVFPETYNTLKTTPYSISRNDSGEIMIFSIMRNDETVYLGVSKL
ncbi:MAG: hypothetical protein M0Q90_04150 [Bacteroidales bacterium]|nr:hypothetical protein [Bacteroidales bacterium]